MEHRGLWPWEILVICGVLVVAAYAIGLTSQSESKPQLPPEAEPNSAHNEALEQLRRRQEDHLRQTAAAMQEWTLKLQTAEAGRSLEKQTFQTQQTDLQEQLRDAKADLRSEQESRESLEEKLKESKDKQRDLEQDYKALERRFEEEMSSVRASVQNVTHTQPSGRVAAYPMGYSSMLSPREARIEEWRQKFQRSQAARDAYNAWLEDERKREFQWAASRLNLENGGAVDWPVPLQGPAFVAHRGQVELAIRTGDLKKLSQAADEAQNLLESRAREFGKTTDAYISAKRFLGILRQMEI